VDAQVHATINYGYAAVGKLVPPTLSELALIANLGGTIDGTLDLSASASGTLDSGSIELFSTGIPGLSFAGILEVGPTFVINAEASATIQAAVGATLDLAYTLDGTQLTFPPNQGSSTRSLKPSNTNIKLSATPDFTANATLQAHLIPSFQFGISALGGKAKATIHLDLDASAEIDLGVGLVGTSASVSTTGNPASARPLPGCPRVDSGIAFNAGADAALLGLFDQSTSVNLFQKDFTLFNQCTDFGASNTKRAIGAGDVPPVIRTNLSSLYKRASLQCPAAVTSAISLVEQILTNG